jgi:hypothetical protein
MYEILIKRFKLFQDNNIVDNNILVNIKYKHQLETIYEKKLKNILMTNI